MNYTKNLIMSKSLADFIDFIKFPFNNKKLKCLRFSEVLNPLRRPLELIKYIKSVN